MTVSTTSAAVSYAGDGSSTTFAVPFQFHGLAVYAVTTSTATLLTLAVHYSVTGGNGSTGSVVAVTAPAVGTSWRIVRVTPQTQTTAITDAGPFPAAAFELAYDKLTMMAQEAGEKAARAMSAPPYDLAPDMVLPRASARANKLLVFDSAGAPTVAEIPGAGTSLTGDASLATVTATGSTTARSSAERAAEVRNIRDFGGVGSGAVDDAAHIQAAVDALPSAGGTVVIGPGAWRLDADVTVPLYKPVRWDIHPGARFTGTGTMPALVTNAAHNFSAWSATTAPGLADALADHGYSTLSLEIIPQADFIGNACGLYAGARGLPGCIGGIWGANTLIEFMPGYLGNGISLEVDLANYTSTPGLGEGVTISGVGTATTGTGLSIKRQDVPSRWTIGVHVEYAEIGMRIDLSDIGSAATNGLIIEGLANNHLKLQPSTDANPTDAVFFVSNAAGSTVPFKLSKNGSIEMAGGITATGTVRADGGLQAKNAAKAWVNFNGAGAVAIRDSFNVSSITDNGTGDYTINLTSAMANANYSITTNVNGAESASALDSARVASAYPLSASTARVITVDNSTDTAFDCAVVCAVFFGA